MMRGIIVVITAGMAMLFLGRKQYIHHWLSLITIVLGVFIVGVVGVTMSSKSEDDSGSQTTLLGVLLLIGA